MSDHFPNFSQTFFRQSKVKFRNKRAGKQQQKNQIKVSNHDKRRNLSYHKHEQRRKSLAETKILNDYVSCFFLHFFRALAASYVFCNRTEHS